MLMLSVIPAVVPTASAGHSTSDVDVHVKHIPRSAGNQSLVRVNDELILDVFANETTGCTGDLLKIQWSATARLAQFGPTYTNTTALSHLSGSAAADYHGRLTITVGEVLTGINNKTTAIDVTVTAKCTAETDVTKPGRSPTFAMDNVPPQAVLDVTGLPPGPAGIGKQFSYGIQVRTDDIDYSEIDLSQLSTLGVVKASGAPASSTSPVTVADMGLDQPVISGVLRDSTGYTRALDVSLNGILFDARKPYFQGATMTPHFGNFVHLNVTPHPLSGNYQPANDVVRYRVSYTPTSLAGPVLCTVGATSGDCKLAAGHTGTWNLTRSDFFPNTVYDFTIVAVDEAGNEAAPVSVTGTRLHPQLRGQVNVSIDHGTGSGGIGTKLNLTTSFHAHNPHNVTRVVVDTSSVGGTTVEWDNTTKPFGQNQTITIAHGADAPAAFPVTLYGPTGISLGTTSVGYKGAAFPTLDAKAPAAPTNLKVFAETNGSVQLQFTPPSDSDVLNYRVNYTRTDTGTSQTAWFNGTTSALSPPFFLDASLFVQGKPYSFSVAAVDDFGNLNAANFSASATTTPTTAPVSVSINHVPAQQTLPGTFSGSWAASDDLVAGNSWLNFTLTQNATGHYWNASSRTFQSDVYVVPLGPISGTGATWAITNVTTAALPPSGNYTVTLFIKNGVTNAQQTKTSWYYVDRHAPDFPAAGTFKNNTIVTDLAKGIQQGVTRLDLRLNVSDWGGVSADGHEIFFTLVHPTTLHNATTASGQELTLRCPAQCALTPALSTTQRWYNGTTSLFFSDVPLGNYRLNVTVYDQAENGISRTFSGDIQVRPRVAIAQGPFTPSVTSNGHLDVYGQAAFEAAQSHDPAGTCPSNVCRVTKVEYYARQGTTGDGTLISTVTIPIAGPGDFLGTGVQYYNYTPSSRPTLSGDFNNTYVRAKATVQLSQSVQFTQLSDWARVRTLDAPAGLVFTNPLLDNSVYQGTAAGRVYFNASYEHAGLDSAPQLNYTVRDRTSQQYVRLSDGTTQASPYSAVLGPSTQSGSVYFYNWTNGVTLPAGDYQLNATVSTPQGERSFTRSFSVASTTPSLSFPATQPDVHHGSHVGREFNISLKVTHGYANVTPGSFAIWMVNGTGATVSPLSYSASLKPIDHIARQESIATWKVTLPQTAANGERYDFRVNVSTTAYQTCTCTLANTSISKPLVLDTVPAAAGTFRDASRNSGTTLSAPLKIEGFAEDAGTGIARVEARIVNLSASTTWHPTHKTFVNGEGDHWFKNASSGFQLTIADRQPSAVDRASWTIDPTALGLKLDRSATYRVDVRAVDKIGLFALANSTTLTFDPLAPNVTAPHASPSGGVVDWHGPGVFQAMVQDNHCLKRVSLMGISPSNVTVGPAPFSNGTYACSATAGNEWSEWTIDLANHPSMTDEVGDYLYWVEAEDASGLKANTSVGGNVTITVRDNTPAEVRFLHLEPSTAPAGGTSLVVAEIFENHAIDRVEAVVIRLSDNVEVGNGTLEPVNVSSTGSGRWSADLALDLNASLELGDYVVRVRAIDNVTAQFYAEQGFCSPACNYMNALLRVTADAPPAVLQTLPASGTELVNATPSFQFRVLHPDISQSGITVTAGTENLTEVTPTFEALRSSNGSLQGYKVSYSVTDPLADGENFSVRVVAVSNKAGLTNTSTFTFRVDGIAPTVAHNLTGAVELGGKTYAVSGTRVSLEAEDNATSLAVLTYRVNGGASQQYTGPITPGGSDGTWTLDYTATDGAGNAATGSLTLQIDRTGPTISIAKHGDELLLTVTDAGAGVDRENVTVHYAYGASAAFTALKMTHVTGNSFEAKLPGNATETGLKYWFQAKDLLGNTNSLHSAGSPHEIEKDQPTVQNLAPTVRITAPGNGASVRGLLSLTWIAEDPEDAPLTVTISLRGPDENKVLQPGGENTGHYTIDTQGFAAGAYTIVLTVTDGVNTANAETTFTVEAGKPVEPVQTPPSKVPVNSAVNVAVRIDDGGKGIANATYRVLRDGAVVKTGPLVSAQGMWGAQFVPSQPGKYQVFVSVQYEDGTSEPASQVASFEVQGQQVTPPESPGFPASLILLLAVGVLTIALAAYGGFVRWKQ